MWPAALGAVAIVAGLLSVLLLRNGRYFFIDDRINGEFPTYMDMGRILRSGEWPWLSTEVVNSGARAVEYATGTFNPLNLVLSFGLADVDNAAIGAFVWVLVHSLLLTAGSAWLARLIGLNTAWSIAFAVSCGFQPYTVLWNDTAWGQGLSSFAWFVLAVAGAFAFHLEPRRRYGWVVLVSTYGAFTAGWPMVIPVLGLFAAVLLLARLLARAPLRATLWLAAWFAGGALCSLIAVYPLLASGEIASRASTIANSQNFLVAPVSGLLQFANPGYYGFFNSFGGYGLQPYPHFYTAWFVLPVLVFWRARPLTPVYATLLRVTVASLVVTAMGSLGPQNLLALRFPTRFLQYSSFFLLLLAGLLVAQGVFTFTRRRLWLVLGATALLAINALQADPLRDKRILASGMALAGLCAFTWWQGWGSRGTRPAQGLARSRWLAHTTVVGGTTVLLLGLAILHPSGRGYDNGFPADLSTVPSLTTDDYTLFYGSYIPVERVPAAYQEYHPATTGLMVGDRQVNGYTSLGHRDFRRHFPIDDQGNFSLGAASMFTQVDPETGLQWLELLRVDQVIAPLGPMADELAETLGDRWRLGGTGSYAASYRHADYGLPGLVSYVSSGLTARAVDGCPQRHSRECVSVDGEAAAGTGRIVFARLWFPGYTATLNGESIPVERYDGTLVSVQFPPGQVGTVMITYRSPGVLPLGLLALLIVGGLAVASWRLGSGATEQVRPSGPPTSRLLDAAGGHRTGRRGRRARLRR